MCDYFLSEIEKLQLRAMDRGTRHILEDMWLLEHILYSPSVDMIKSGVSVVEGVTRLIVAECGGSALVQS